MVTTSKSMQVQIKHDLMSRKCKCKFSWEKELRNLTYLLEFQKTSQRHTLCSDLYKTLQSEISVWTQIFVFSYLKYFIRIDKQKNTTQSWHVNERAQPLQGEDQGEAEAEFASFSKFVLVVCWVLL